jgi:transposase-like protein
MIESDHRFVKHKMYQTFGVGSYRTAAKTITGVEQWRMLKKG